MNSEKLSKRLETVVSFIPEGSRIADIGSDHAYLPCYAVDKGIAVSGVAGEVAEGPYQSAVKQVKYSQLEDSISVRKGDGLQVIRPNETDCITIAGMGGALIASILENGKSKLEGVSRLVLQPNVGASSIRKWLLKNGWELKSEQILEEDDKIYEVLAADKGNPEEPYTEANRDSELLLGPFLMKENSPVFKRKWKHELKQWKTIIDKMEEAEDSPQLRERRDGIQKKIEIVEEVLDENR
ncbi:tRNA (adenine-N(1))-methyltransferase [Rossellomorea vietnamensis]|uniref:tRNA (Adenine-N(1))-methyltransferase n=1 Tax=Rossellomorea vietnamensis TaxID=218284 RepID=A0A5D4P4B1_9BACI|nr:tRNA (adenine(22)-N(1))-methyltransferase TrmK [Rossellomorea vietnamensis]TYS19492.1 tRNA (adenine-N(1))-methyltransferase [Rossellomorea vietnamensis]